MLVSAQPFAWVFPFLGRFISEDVQDVSTMEVILETTASNTPENIQDLPPEYCNISPPPPHLGSYHEASARNTTPSESSDETEVSGASQNSLEIQWEVDTAIQRAQNSIDPLSTVLCIEICNRLI